MYSKRKWIQDEDVNIIQQLSMLTLLVTHNAKAMERAKTSVHKVFEMKRLKKRRGKVERGAPNKSSKKKVNQIIAVSRQLIYFAGSMEFGEQQWRMTPQSSFTKP